MTGQPIINQAALEKLNQDPHWARDYYRGPTYRHYRAKVEAAVKANQGSIGQTTDAIMAILLEHEEDLFPLIEVNFEDNLNLQRPADGQ